MDMFMSKYFSFGIIVKQFYKNNFLVTIIKKENNNNNIGYICMILTECI